MSDANLEFRKKVFNYSTAFVIEQLSVDVPRKEIQKNLAYALEAHFRVDMLLSIQLAEALMTKMPKVMKQMEELAEKRKNKIDEMFKNKEGA